MPQFYDLANLHLPASGRLTPNHTQQSKMTDADAAAGPTTSSTLPRAEAESASASAATASSRPEEKDIKEMLPRTLSRLTAGLPMHELDVIIKEAKACEDAL